MGKIVSSYININKLKGKPTDSSSVKSASRVSVYDGNKWVDKMRLTNGSTIVWDVLNTTFITPDTSIRIPAAGGSLVKPAVESKNSLYYIISQDKISSYSTNVENTVREIEHYLYNNDYNKYDKVDPNLNENNIGPNTSSSERSYTIRARQSITGVESNITVIQDANAVTTSWSSPQVNENQGYLGVRLFNKDDQQATYVRADGTSEVCVQVYVTQQKQIINTSGETSNQTFSDWVDVTAISGDSYNGGAMNSSGYMTASNRTTVTGNERTIYNIKSFTYTSFDGKQYTYNMYNTYAESITVNQQANNISYGSWSYSISASTTTTSYNAASVSTSATVTSKGTRTYSYTSGSKDGNNNTETTNVGWTASITSANGNSVSPTSASAGTTSAQIKLGANTSTSSSKSTVVTFKSTGNTSKTATITFTQSKDAQVNPIVNYTLNAPTVTQVPAAGGNSTVSMTVTKKSTPLYVSGNTGTTSTSTLSVTISSIGGSALNSSGASVSGTKVSVKSLANTEKTSTWNVFNLTSVKGTDSEGNSRNWSGSVYVTQGANTVTYSSWTYSISASTSQTSYTAISVTPSVTVSSTRSRTAKWTSGYDPNGNNNLQTENYGWTASISGSGNSVNPTSASAGTTRATVTLGANTSTSSAKTSTVTFKSSGDTSKTSSITFTQSKDEVARTQVTITAHNATAVQIPASGGQSMVSMTVKRVATPIYVSGSTGTSTTTYPAATVTSISGSAVNSSGAYASGANIYVGSLGTTVKNSAWNVFQVTSVTGTYEGKSCTYNTAFYITQGANVAVSTRYANYTLDLTSSTTSISASGQKVSINVTANRTKYTKYTSGTEDSGVKENINAILTTSHGTVSASSSGSFAGSATVTGGKTAYFIANANTTTSSKTLTVSAKLSDNTSITDSISFTQSAASFEFEVKPASGEIPYGGGSFDFNVITTINNGGFTNAPTVTSNNTAFIIDSIVFNDILMDRYTVTVRANANTSTSARSATLTFTQAGSGQKLTATISQAGKPSSGGGGGNTSNVEAYVEAWYDSSYQISYYASFSGIESYLDRCTVYVTNNPHSYDRYYGQPMEHETILPNDSINGVIESYDFQQPMYVVVVVNDNIVGYSIVE